MEALNCLYICDLSLRLYYLKQLRRCGVVTEDLIMFYKTVIVPVLEYGCAGWHTSLTKQDSETLEFIHLQKSNQ